ncbi:hypothetical protein AMATHDRAFT_8224 [Amanita thiersii Skay4041]|uniref:Uncharacterized protein n=1 Tax=Amanita thiersii Skay4041 TaxID=703135 RepID=A0A2A9N9V3_9AGAR|nr:hypothetical protein AMATHDRAFT_8224 [Amanita thiersii Skay4041]
MSTAQSTAPPADNKQMGSIRNNVMTYDTSKNYDSKPESLSGAPAWISGGAPLHLQSEELINMLPVKLHVSPSPELFTQRP